VKDGAARATGLVVAPTRAVQKVAPMDAAREVKAAAMDAGAGAAAVAEGSAREGHNAIVLMPKANLWQQMSMHQREHSSLRHPMPRAMSHARSAVHAVSVETEVAVRQGAGLNASNQVIAPR
jgi:hypothetical protein